MNFDIFQNDVKRADLLKECILTDSHAQAIDTSQSSWFFLQLIGKFNFHVKNFSHVQSLLQKSSTWTFSFEFLEACDVAAFALKHPIVVIIILFIFSRVYID